MSYTYDIELHLAEPKPTLNLLDKADIIRKAELEYNLRSVHMQNCKTIKIHSIMPSFIKLTLSSDLFLNTVGRALRTFSMILIADYKDQDFISQVTKGGALFKTIQVNAESNVQPSDSTIDFKQLSDLDLIKALMDYVYNKRDPDSTIYRKKRQAMEDIKRISIESGLIT